MNLEQALLSVFNTFSGAFTAIIVIAGFVAKIKPIGAALKRFAFAELYAANEQQDRRLDNLEMQQLKQIICDRRLPDGERLNAGEEYIRRGGNGEIRAIHEAAQEAARRKLLAEQERTEREGRERRGNA